MTERPRRSALFMPGSNARAIEKARSLTTDVVILDLEDAVAPASKDAARAQVAAEVEAGGFGHRELVIGVNGLDTAWGAADVQALAGLRADACLFPKVERAEDVHAALAALDAAGGADRPIWAMVETPLAILNLQAIAAASPRLTCLVAGTSDLGKAMRVAPTTDRMGLVPALVQCVIAARAYGLDVLDGVQLDIQDADALAAVCAQGAALGFDGKSLIHPTQIEPANRAFSPSPDTVERSGRIIAAWEAAQAAGDGVVVVDGALVENLHVDEARRVLALDAAIRRG